jgi:hypothetical protein
MRLGKEFTRSGPPVPNIQETEKPGVGKPVITDKPQVKGRV